MGKKNKQIHKPVKNIEENIQTSSKWKTVLVLLTIIFSVLYAYNGAFDNDFVFWDDEEYVIENEMVRDAQYPLGQIFKQIVSLNYHPITMLSLHFQGNECKDCIQGISAEPFIKVNVLLHILNTCLVFFFVCCLVPGSYWPGLIVALVFGLHPMHVESVAWVSERKDVLYVFFFLLGLLSYYKYLKAKLNPYKWLIICFICFILSCLSKGMAVVFPLILILINFWEAKEATTLKAIKACFNIKRVVEIIPFLLVSLFFGLIALKVQNGENFLGLFEFQELEEGAVVSVEQFGFIKRIKFACYGILLYNCCARIPIYFNWCHHYC